MASGLVLDVWTDVIAARAAEAMNAIPDLDTHVELRFVLGCPRWDHLGGGVPDFRVT